ncbi:metalloregulator ArsR/SmtB family transcription factor [Streptomyces radiopugnans]|uniref:ArsR/SmtB family transcription factor n=1 Tax=Streptomyces radiopugnans TaxID=403935 RepID=UPI003F1B26A5
MLTVASDIEVLVRFGRALADPIRCRLLLALRQAPAYPSDLADSLGISRTRLSNHLACLRDCGLVVTVPDGRRTRYELADERLGHALDDLRTVDAVRALTGTGEAEPSVPGVVLAALSLAIMPFLSLAQRRAGRELGSASAVADSKQTLLCTYLSAVLLVGLLLNATLGWSWADPVAALVIVAVAVKEGREAWRGENCCVPSLPTAAAPGPADADGYGCGPNCA